MPGRIRARPRAARQQEGSGDAVTAQARANKPKIDWLLPATTAPINPAFMRGSLPPPKPKFIGRRAVQELRPGELAQYIDWGPFFQTWDLHGPFPQILTDEVVGESARQVFAEGQAMLKRIIDGRWLTANGVVAFLPANAVNDDDIEIYTDDTRSEVAVHLERPAPADAQADGVDGSAASEHIALATSSRRSRRGIADYIGALRGHQRPRHREAREALRRRARRLLGPSC